MKIVTLCGSLRAQSSNQAILQAYARLAPAGVTVEHYQAMGSLPHFNPDLDGETVPTDVATLRDLIASADTVVISTPEYVHALPGSFKNALDWLVSDPRFAGKPVVILHVARGSSWALDSLREVLRTMSARLIDNAQVLLPLSTNKVDADAILAREDLRKMLEESMRELISKARPSRVEAHSRPGEG